jgi:glycine oxidase
MPGSGGAPHVAVVGGGITGAFTAYFLARLGIPVTLIERLTIGAEASGKNPGGLNPLYGAGIPGPLTELALDAFRLHLEHWDDLRRLSGIDFSGRHKQRLNLALDENDIRQLEGMKEVYDSTAGFSALWLDRQEVREVEPGLDAAVVAGLLAGGDAKVDAARYTQAIARSAYKLGAKEVVAEVCGLQKQGERVTAVLLDRGPLACSGVVIASGPWCAGPARWLEMSIPVEPVKGEMVLVEAGREDRRTDIAWRDAMLYPAGDGKAWLGGTEERVGFDTAPSASGRRSILERIARVLPGLAGAHVVAQTAALRPATPDALPIAGATARWENVCLALGGGRKGVLLSAAMGRAAAELIARGSTDVPIACCTPDRWAAQPAGLQADR